MQHSLTRKWLCQLFTRRIPGSTSSRGRRHQASFVGRRHSTRAQACAKWRVGPCHLRDAAPSQLVRSRSLAHIYPNQPNLSPSCARFSSNTEVSYLKGVIQHVRVSRTWTFRWRGYGMQRAQGRRRRLHLVPERCCIEKPQHNLAIGKISCQTQVVQNTAATRSLHMPTTSWDYAISKAFFF